MNKEEINWILQAVNIMNPNGFSKEGFDYIKFFEQVRRMAHEASVAMDAMHSHTLLYYAAKERFKIEPLHVPMPDIGYPEWRVTWKHRDQDRCMEAIELQVALNDAFIQVLRDNMDDMDFNKKKSHEPKNKNKPSRNPSGHRRAARKKGSTGGG